MTDHDADRSADVQADDAVDLRLVALGLAPPPRAEPAASPDAPPPASPPPSPTAAPSRAAPPPSPAAPTPAHAWPIGAAQSVETTTRVEVEVVLLFRHPVRGADLEVWTDHVQVGARRVDSGAIAAVTTRGEHVRIRTASETLRFAPTVDGIADGALAKVIAEIVLDASSGAPPRATLLRQLTDTSAELKRRARELDAQFVPLLVLVGALPIAAFLLVVLPAIDAVPFRSGITIAPATFLLYPRLSPFDPRVVVAALAAGSLLAALAMSAAVGHDLAVWARATLAGGGSTRGAILALPRGLAALIVVHTRELAVALAVALVLYAPAGRERTLVDAAGVHLRAEVPFLDRDVAWRDVVSATLLQDAGSYAVTLATRDGVILDTRGQLFYGASEYELHQFAQRQRAASQ